MDDGQWLMVGGRHVEAATPLGCLVGTTARARGAGMRVSGGMGLGRVACE